MSLAGAELRAAYYCCAEVIRSRQRAGQPIPQWLRRHYELLDQLIRTPVSQPRHEFTTGGEASTSENTATAREVAGMVGLSLRQLQRRAREFGGRLVHGRYLFDLDAVAEHLEGS